MISRILAVVLLGASVALAKPTTTPSTTHPVRMAIKPSTQPVAKTSDKSSFAKEVFSKFEQRNRRQREDLKIAYIDLDRPLEERPAPFALFADNSITLHSVISRIHQARDDKNVRALLLNIGDTQFNLAQAMEVRNALTELRKFSKKSFVYADAYDTPSYIAASGASNICLMPGGELMIPGVGLETLFAKGLLDKLGVKADYIQIGQYKGADEEFTRTEPSKELRGELNKLVDGLYDQIVDGIANARNISRNDVIDVINGVYLNARAAKDRHFVDHLIDQDGLRDLMKGEMGREVDVVHGYGLPERDGVDFANPLSFLSALTGGKKAATASSDKPEIAIVFAEGVITDGEVDDNLFSGGDVGSTDFRKYIRMASRDENVKAIVVRIDSPGGSAQASEVMWQAVRRAAKKKPVVISVGGMAASGGYYLASAGDYIFADPSAIVGSIGVVGGKFVVKDLFGKIGVNSENFVRGANADLFSWNKPFTEQQKRMVTNWMQQTYDQFTERVMSTRKGKISQIDDVARGRVFLAKQAKQLGMVDELGGIQDAVTYAAQKVHLESGKYGTKLIPGTRTLLDLLRGGDGEEAIAPMRPELKFTDTSLFRMLPRSSARLLATQVQAIQLLQRRPIVLMSPYVITLK